MNDYTKDIFKNKNIKIPDGWSMIDSKTELPMKEEYLYWHWTDEVFRPMSWWEKHDQRLLEIINYRVTQSMIAIKLEKVKTKIHVPVEPEKLRVIKNVKRLIKI